MFLLLVLPLLSHAAWTGRHIDATNCEIFVDKLALSVSSHSSHTIQPFVKILPQRLDAPVKEVGFHSSETTHGYNGGHDGVEPWRDHAFFSVSPVNDYYTVPWGFPVGSDFGSSSFEGAFYVVTTAGTTYWAKTSGGGNFRFDGDFFRSLWSSGSSGPNEEFPTQSPVLRGLNPQGCY